MPGIFISYRREDSAGYAGRLFSDLQRRFGPELVFMDVAGIGLGQDFRKVVDRQVSGCDVLLAIVGKGWVDARNAASERRLDDAKDFVRLEIGAALKRDIAVIPVLVDGAGVPRAEELPADLEPLAWRHGMELRHARWDDDVGELIAALEKLTRQRPAGEEPPRAAASQARDSARPQPARKGLWLGAAVVLLVALGAGWLWRSSLGDKVDVPGLIGQNRAAAVAALERSGLALGAVTEKEAGDTARGTVLSQRPTAGAKLAAGSAVDVVVAGGPARATVPDVMGRSLADAKALLARAGLGVGAVRRRAEPDSPDGTVIDQDPSSGKSLERGAKVDLVFAAPQLRMPDLIGLHIKDAMARLEQTGLKLTSRKSRATDASPPWTVIEQQPAAGRPTAKGAGVALVYAVETRRPPATSRGGETYR